MIAISKSEAFFRAHLKALLIIGLFSGLIIGSTLAVAYIEGAFLDPQGQLNSPITLECNAGLLANRTVTITDDGEYNWMFVKNQQVIVQIMPLEENVSMQVFFSSYQKIISHTWLNATDQRIVWSFQIYTAGHYRLELANWEIRAHPVQIYVNALPLDHAFGLLDCLNPGDLFRVG